MAYLYLTKNYKNIQIRYNRLLQPHFEAIKKLDDPAPILKRYGGLPLFCKKVRNLRIIFQKIDVPISNQTYSVYCVRTVLPRGSNEYTHFLQKIKEKKWLEDNQLSSDEFEEIKKWLKSELEKERKSSELPALPEELKKWLNINKLLLSNATIYETQEWTEAIREKKIYDFKETICNMIASIQDDPNSLSMIWKSNNKNNITLVKGRNKIYILYEKLGNILVLYKIFKDKKPDENVILDILKKYCYHEKFNRDLLLRDAKRAYPDYILAAPELWFKIQEDNVANLALSPEEEDLLQSATFPLFVNGQAGSGKSTILYYLFAHFCSLGHDENLLFLTYNQKLLETARKNVISILKSHPNYSELKLNYEKIETYFNPFQDFILNYLLSDDERQNFLKRKYISYNKFKQFFTGTYHKEEFNCKLSNKNRYSPELVWHIIRTYIKGSSDNDYFSPDQYNELNRKDKSVNEEMYNEIFDTVWDNWYNKLSQDYQFWDDQDLIRFVLKKNTDDFPQFPVIFCDEAQDFTKIEIELLLHLSKFTKYNLSHYNNLPFAFAGDPYQTINPTGFRWETLKTIFNDRFEKLNPQGLNIRFEALTQNYRSKPLIIKFANLIQGIRYKYLAIKELRPQSPWQKMEGIKPCIFILDEDISAEDLQNLAKETIILIPGETGENSEYNYVKNDPILNSFIQNSDNENKFIKNIMNSSTSKGLEFDRVLLYKFGESVPDAFPKVITNENLNESEYIELSYYFNKLYVAVTRAKNFLFILDTREGFEKFWQYFMNKDLLQTEFTKETYWTKSDVAPLIKGTQADIIYIKEENPEKVAKEFEDYGMMQGDYEALQRAVEFYKSKGLNQDALRCKAWAYWFKEDWLNAGNIFSKLKKYKEASLSFWRGRCWEKLTQLHRNESGKNYRYKLSMYMLNKETLDILSTIIDEVVDHIEPTDEAWREVVEKIKKDLEKITTPEKYSKYAVLCKKLGGKGFKELYSLAGKLYFKDNSYEQAINCWDRNADSEHKDYYKAKLNISYDSNDKIFWNYKLRDDDSILKIYKEASDKNIFSSASREIVFGALLRNNAFDDALYIDIPIQTRVNRLLQTITTLNSDEQFNYKRKIFDLLLDSDKGVTILQNRIKDFRDFFHNKQAIRCILKHQNWKELLNILEKELRMGLPGKFIESFVDVICEELKAQNTSKLFYAIDLVGKLNKKDDKLTENVKLIKAIAYSTITPDKFSVTQREHLEKFITKCIWEKTGWQSELNIQEFATALERVGAKSITLQNEIYEHIISYEPDFKEWAKVRWIKVAQRRAKYENEQGNDLFAKKIERDIKNKIKEWRLNNDLIAREPEYPILQKSIPTYTHQKVTITGFSESPTIDEKRKRIILLLDNYEINIFWITKTISIDDLSSNLIVSIDILKQDIAGLDVTRKENSFTVKNYRGEFSDQNTLLLEIENLSLRITFA